MSVDFHSHGIDQTLTFIIYLFFDVYSGWLVLASHFYGIHPICL